MLLYHSLYVLQSHGMACQSQTAGPARCPAGVTYMRCFHTGSTSARPRIDAQIRASVLGCGGPPRGKYVVGRFTPNLGVVGGGAKYWPQWETCASSTSATRTELTTVTTGVEPHIYTQNDTEARSIGVGCPRSRYLSQQTALG